jgi:hypothetical protein
MGGRFDLLVALSALSVALTTDALLPGDVVERRRTELMIPVGFSGMIGYRRPVGGSLMSSGEPPPARCSHCGATAVGPCARCRRPTCGDCCELTEGGVMTFAVCLACIKRSGKSLGHAYGSLLLWLGAIIVGLATVAALLVAVRR